MLTERDNKVLRWIEEYKAITVPQATEIFFNHNYEGCRRRLKQLESIGCFKSYTSKLINEKVYYQEKKIRDHDLLVYDFIKQIYKNNATLRKLKIQPTYCSGLIRPDAYIEFAYRRYVYFVLLEVDYTHYTDYKKLQMYEYLYRQEVLQKECYGTFPILVISRPQIGTRYMSKNFDCLYTDLRFKNLSNLLIPITN